MRHGLTTECFPRSSMSEQLASFGLEPALRVAIGRADGRHQGPEPPRVVLLAQVHQLVQQDVLAYVRRHLHEPEVQRDRAGPRARTPSRTLIPDAHACHGQAVFRRQRDQTRRKIAARPPDERRLECRAEIQGPRNDADADVTRGRNDPAATRTTGDRNDVAVEQNPRALRPCRGRTRRRQLTRAFPKRPREVTSRELDRFRTRTAARKRHAERSVLTYAQDVPPRAGNTN